MKTTYLKFSIYFLVLVTLSCSTDIPENRENEEEGEVITRAEFTPVQYRNAGITLGKLEYKNLRDVVRSSGYLEVPPQNKASIVPLIGGIIKEIHVLEGNYVKKGQLLVRMEHPDFIKLQEEYIKALTSYSFLQEEYRRQSELMADNVNAKKVFQQTESNFNAVRGQVRSLEVQLKMLALNPNEIASGTIIPVIPIYSPINGYVNHINASIGTFAESREPIMNIVDNSKVHVDLMVYEKDIYKVKPDQKVEFVLTNQDNWIISGKIFGISKSFENETKALVVHASILGESPELIPGMFVNALIETGTDSVPALPEEAIASEAGKEFIFMKITDPETDGEKEVFSKVEVKTGLRDLGYAEVLPLEEIPANADIAVGGTFYIHSVFKPGMDQE